MYNLDENDDFDRELIATYEEGNLQKKIYHFLYVFHAKINGFFLLVSKLYPRPGVYRPIVLIGAPGVGRNELKRRLVARDPEKYRSPVPCKNFHYTNYFTRYLRSKFFRCVLFMKY